MSPPAPIPLQEAQQRLLDMIRCTEQALRPLADSDGYCLAQDLHARRTQPAADLSAMDGYVVREDDLVGPWQVVGESAAGHPFSGTLEPGQAIRISTGALMPDRGGAVLLQENATRDDDTLSLNGEGDPTTRHIRREGFDFREGDLLLKAGTRMNAARIALAICAGHANASFNQLPKIAIIDSGDELVSDPATTTPHQIPASNGDMLAAMVAPYASEVVRLGPVNDRLEDLLAALEQTEGCAMIATSGGVSVGDHDLVRPALEQWGATIDFWRIAIKPGKPLMVAQKGNQTILGLPGNPVSSYVTAFLFLLPALRAMVGATEPLPRTVSLPLVGDLPAIGNRTEFVRARLIDGKAVPLSEQDSSALMALSRADMLIRRDIGTGPAGPDELVACYLLQNGGIA
jgi:molybdopterin molybdotransferase